MTLIATVLLIVGFIYLANRISMLEDQVRKLQKGAPAPTPAPTPVAEAQIAAPQAKPLAAAPATPLPTPPQTPAPTRSSFDEVSGGKILGRVGIAALFIGIAFFLKYAFDNNLIGVEGRIILGLLLGAVFIAAGQYYRAKYMQYAYLLVGGGIAILYLTLFAAFNLYHLVSQPLAFAAMIAVTAIAVFISVFDEALPLATVAALGGFVTPYLLQTDISVPIVLFTYIAILDLGMLVLAIRQRWPLLVYISFVTTGVQYFTWYVSEYSMDQLQVAVSFLTLFFLIFLAVPILNKRFNLSAMRDFDLVVTSFNAIGYFVLLYVLLNAQYHEIMWLVALALACVYGALAYTLSVIDPQDRLSCDFYIAIASIFVTVAVPLKLDHSAVTLAWLLEAGFLYAIAFQYKRQSLHAIAAFAYTLGLMRLVWEYVSRDQGQIQPFFNEYAPLFIIAIAICYAVVYLSYKDGGTVRESANAYIAGFYFAIANILTVFFLTSEISAYHNRSLVTLVWLLEAGFLYIVAFEYKRPIIHVFAALAFGLGLVRLFSEYLTRDHLLAQPFFNEFVALFLISIVMCYAVAYVCYKTADSVLGSSSTALSAFYFAAANILSVFILTAEISAYYNARSRGLSTYAYTDIKTQKNTVISIAWSLYAVALIIAGFVARSRIARIGGLIFFFITAFKIFIDVWSYGELYRIVASVVFGAIALFASFMYVRYSERIKTMLYTD